MKNTNNVGYKQLMQYFAKNDEEKETLQILFCEDKATFNELAEYYQTTPPTMRRVVMDVFGRRDICMRKIKESSQQKMSLSIIKENKNTAKVLLYLR